MEQSLDPYEEQLFKVFASHDNDNSGSLDKNGLLKLCETLQLEEKGNELLKALLNDCTSRVTFPEFKDALLKLLGNMQSKDEMSDAAPSDREVSPKYVYGSKKYGRRSRPREDLNIKEQNDFHVINKTSTPINRSNSQYEVTYSKKRKTNTKLKRCTSFPGDKNRTGELPTSNVDFICTEDMLKEAWKKLGVGENGYLNRNELILICDAIGLNKLAESIIRQLSNKFVLDYNKKISFEELLDALKQDETWNEFLNYSNNSELETHNVSQEANFYNSKVLQHIKLGPDGSGFINSDLIVELWERAGILSPKSLLLDLGFKEMHISIMELSSVLEKEIKGLNELRIDHTCNPHVALLQAFVTLYQTEIKCLKNVLEQMHDEREKLKCDVSEANNRATLLAQEVDDNVAKMELTSQKQVKLLEQRHSDILKDLTKQFSLDKEQMTLLNQNLESKIHNLESEVLQLRDDLINAQKYNSTVEKENIKLNNKITELEDVNSVLKLRIDALEIEKIKCNDIETEKKEKLMESIAKLQLENNMLKDKHDEMVSKIEIIANENMSLKGKSKDYNDDKIEEDLFEMSFGSKRKNFDTSMKDLPDSDLDESPSLGKVRKCKTYEMLQSQVNESGYEAEQDDNMDDQYLLTRIKLLERILTEHSIEIPSNIPVSQTTKKNENATTQVNVALLTEIKTQMEETTNYSDVHVQSTLEILEKIFNSERCMKIINSYTEEIMEKMKKTESERVMLQSKVDNLESGLDLLRVEYDKCEDYWQNKIEEERNLYELEQIQSSEKLSELLGKLTEYEEQFVKDNRLPTIDEALALEQQVLDLESEFETYKKTMSLKLSEKDSEIHNLRTKEIVNVDATVQVNEEKQLNLTHNVIESLNLYAVDAMPFDWVNKIDDPNINKIVPWNNECNSLPPAWKTDSMLQNDITLPSTSEPDILENNSMPFRSKRIRYHKKYVAENIFQKQNKNTRNSEVNNCSGEESNSSEPRCWMPVKVLHNLQMKRHNLEQRCKKLQYILKQQHHYDEQLRQYSWQQYNNEKAELQLCIKICQNQLKQLRQITAEQQDRLLKNDLLVKDLFVDNAYLIAKNQRLEHQCHILNNNFNTNSV